MGPIIAIGGYKTDWSEEGCFDTPLEIDQRIVKLTGKKKPTVLFIPTASSDSVGYTRAFTQVYGEKLGCPVDVLRLIAEKPSHKEIAEKIRAADLIYVGGGNTLMMMNKWRRLGVDKLLIEAHQRGTVLAGVSAGAICWYEWGVSDSRQFYDKDSHEYIRVRGLGLVKGLCCPHFGSSLYDKGYRMEGLRKILKRHPKLQWVGIKDGEVVEWKSLERPGEFNAEAFSENPDGNEIELYIDVPGVDWKKDPDLFFTPGKRLKL